MCVCVCVCVCVCCPSHFVDKPISSYLYRSTLNLPNTSFQWSIVAFPSGYRLDIKESKRTCTLFVVIPVKILWVFAASYLPYPHHTQVRNVPRSISYLNPQVRVKDHIPKGAQEPNSSCVSGKEIICIFSEM